MHPDLHHQLADLQRAQTADDGRRRRADRTPGGRRPVRSLLRRLAGSPTGPHRPAGAPRPARDPRRGAAGRP